MKNFLSSLFRSKRELRQLSQPLSLSAVCTDMHSHFLPGIDDGATSLEDSVTLIQGMQALGYKRLITTPHIYWDLYKNTSAIILEKLEMVRAELARQHIDMELEAAAEYFCDEHFEALIERRDILSFGDQKYVLLEISFMDENVNLPRALFNLRLAGYKPVLAHPERYEYWHGKFSQYEKYFDQEIIFQLNINSLTGQYGPGVRRISERLIDKGMIQFLGSDCHHLGHLNLMETARKSPHLKKLIDSGILLNTTL
jgi:protein-tyrosine phosphatase